ALSASAVFPTPPIPARTETTTDLGVGAGSRRAVIWSRSWARPMNLAGGPGTASNATGTAGPWWMVVVLPTPPCTVWACTVAPEGRPVIVLRALPGAGGGECSLLGERRSARGRGGGEVRGSQWRRERQSR